MYPSKQQRTLLIHTVILKKENDFSNLLRTFGHFSFLCPPLLIEAVTASGAAASLSDRGLAGIKQLNAWADYFRESLPPVPPDRYLPLCEG